MDDRKTGVITQFGQKRYGFIAGDDGQSYFFHQSDIVCKDKLFVKDKVFFTGQKTSKGLSAKEVDLIDTAAVRQSSSMSPLVKFLFIVLFAVQIVTLYLVLK